MVPNIPPRILTCMLDGALKQQGQNGDGNVRMNAMRRPVEHRMEPCSNPIRGDMQSQTTDIP